MRLTLAGVTKESFVDGPGIRYVVFSQGCPHHCEGCHNPQTHPFSGGYEEEIEVLLKQMEDNPLQDGVTFSGGEPFSQSEAFEVLAKKTKEKGLNIWTYTGFLYEDLIKWGEEKESIKNFLSYIDVLVDGPFKLEERTLGKPFIGSKNQRLIDVQQSLLTKEVVLWEPPIW